MTIRVEPAAATPCWVLRHPDGTEYEHLEGGIHFGDHDAAERFAFENYGDPLSAAPLNAPCLVGVCRECGVELEADYGVHYETRQEAEQAVAEGCLNCS